MHLPLICVPLTDVIQFRLQESVNKDHYLHSEQAKKPANESSMPLNNSKGKHIKRKKIHKIIGIDIYLGLFLQYLQNRVTNGN